MVPGPLTKKPYLKMGYFWQCVPEGDSTPRGLLWVHGKWLFMDPMRSGFPLQDLWDPVHEICQYTFISCSCGDTKMWIVPWGQSPAHTAGVTSLYNRCRLIWKRFASKFTMHVRTMWSYATDETTWDWKTFGYERRRPSSCWGGLSLQSLFCHYARTYPNIKNSIYYSVYVPRSDPGRVFHET